MWFSMRFIKDNNFKYKTTFIAILFKKNKHAARNGMDKMDEME